MAFFFFCIFLFNVYPGPSQLIFKVLFISCYWVVKWVPCLLACWRAALVFSHARSNPDLRRTEPVLESSLQRTSSGSSSSSSTPSSQPSSQGGSQPGSQAGSSERSRVRGKVLHSITPGRKAGAERRLLSDSGSRVATGRWYWKLSAGSCLCLLRDWTTIPNCACDIRVWPPILYIYLKFQFPDKSPCSGLTTKYLWLQNIGNHPVSQMSISVRFLIFNLTCPTVLFPWHQTPLPGS
jgi:hypothetical protein